ncbi:hypothetical protein ACIQM4_03275 [Streptomyces sp. NPDC091272]|uniref:hypothetical protein n=1 Tax=Streptomyces sp. NPDC091272 TaxID=3365981 RepID=UPI0038158471
MNLTEHHITVAAGKLIKHTGVLWQDILLQVCFYAGIFGLLIWFAWWWQERRHGVRGAAEKYRALGRRMRTRRILAAASMVAALVQIGFGIALAAAGDKGGDGTALLVFGGVPALAWLIVLPLCRPLPRPADDRSVKHAPTRAEPWDDVSYAHLPDDIPRRGRGA